MTAKRRSIGLGLMMLVALVGCAAQPGDGGTAADTRVREGEQPTGQTLPSSDQTAGVAAAASTVVEPRSSHDDAPVSVNIADLQDGMTADADSLSPQGSAAVTSEGEDVPALDVQTDGHDPDCNTNGIPDHCDLSCAGTCGVVFPGVCGGSLDCNTNRIPDDCDIAEGTSADCNTNTVPDECELEGNDCNTNRIPDDCDIAEGTSADCNTNTVPDECELEGNDCNTNRIPDDCDIAAGTSEDCNTNSMPDECDIAAGTSQDCNTNSVPDECELAGNDCNTNGVPDDCDIAAGTSEDCNTNSVPDECETDTDGDGLIDDCDACPESDLGETIVIDGCDSEVVNVLGGDGCTMADQIAGCADGATNHGAFVSCVAHLTNEWKADGLISGREKGRIQSCAARADIP